MRRSAIGLAVCAAGFSGQVAAQSVDINGSSETYPTFISGSGACVEMALQQSVFPDPATILRGVVDGDAGTVTMRSESRGGFPGSIIYAEITGPRSGPYEFVCSVTEALDPQDVEPVWEALLSYVGQQPADEGGLVLVDEGRVEQTFCLSDDVAFFAIATGTMAFQRGVDASDTPVIHQVVTATVDKYFGVDCALTAP